MIERNTPRRPLRARLVATLAALLVAIALLVTIVLPAEYGWDPLGSGAALGLLSGEEPHSDLWTSETDAADWQLIEVELG